MPRKTTTICVFVYVCMVCGQVSLCVHMCQGVLLYMTARYQRVMGAAFLLMSMRDQRVMGATFLLMSMRGQRVMGAIFLLSWAFHPNF